MKFIRELYDRAWMLTWPITETLLGTIVACLTHHPVLATGISNGGSIVSFAFGLLHLTAYDRVSRLESRLVRRLHRR